MMLRGEVLPAARALEWGLVTRVLPSDMLMQEAQRMSIELTSGPAHALAAIRAQCWRATEASFDEMLALEHPSNGGQGSLPTP